MSEDAIRSVVEAYYHAMVAGDEAALRQVFDPEARFQGWRDGSEVRRDLDAFTAMLQTPYDGEAHTEWRIDLVDRTGPVAIVRVVDWFRGRYYTDYLTLAQRNGAWIIVNKCFYAHHADAKGIDDLGGDA